MNKKHFKKQSQPHSRTIFLLPFAFGVTLEPSKI
jgi:hypothetical protein